MQLRLKVTCVLTGVYLFIYERVIVSDITIGNSGSKIKMHHGQKYTYMSADCDTQNAKINSNETENLNETVNSNETDHRNKEFLNMFFGTFWGLFADFKRFTHNMLPSKLIKFTLLFLIPI